jgi:signal transduction histidine kinase
VNDVVEEALLLTEPQLRHRKIAITRHLHDARLPPVTLDPDQLKQALLNLILNAADAMAHGGELIVTAGANDAGSAVCIEICDDGTGIDPRIREKLFQPFFSSKREGIGLGLVNAKSIVERHGGTIALLPSHGKGTRAVITLPARGGATRPAGAEVEK